MADQRNLEFGFSLDTGEINKDAQKIQSSLNVITDGFNKVDNSVTTSMTNLQKTMSELQDSINSLSSSIGSDLASQLKSIKFDDFTEKTSAIRKDLEELKKSFEGLEVGNNNQFSGIITTLATIKTELEKSFQQITEQAEKINRALLTIGNIGTNNTSIQAFDDLISDASIQKIEKLIDLANKPVQSSWNIDSLVDGLVKLNATAQMVNQTVGNVTITNTSNNGSDVTKDMITSLEQVKTTMEGLNTAIGFDENRLASINKIRTELESLTHLDFTNLNDLVDKLKGLQQSLDVINFKEVSEKLQAFANETKNIKFTGITNAIVNSLRDPVIQSEFSKIKENVEKLINQLQPLNSPTMVSGATPGGVNTSQLEDLVNKINKLLNNKDFQSKVALVNEELKKLGLNTNVNLVALQEFINKFPNTTKTTNNVQAINKELQKIGLNTLTNIQKIQTTLNNILNARAISSKVSEFNKKLSHLGSVQTGLNDIQTLLNSILAPTNVKTNVGAINTVLGTLGNGVNVGISNMQAQLDKLLDVQDIQSKVNQINTSLTALGNVAVNTMMNSLQNMVRTTLDQWLRAIQTVQNPNPNPNPIPVPSNVNDLSANGRLISTTANNVTGTSVQRGIDQAGNAFRQNLDAAGQVVGQTVTYIDQGKRSADELLARIKQVTAELKNAQTAYAAVLKDQNASQQQLDMAKNRYESAQSTVRDTLFNRNQSGQNTFGTGVNSIDFGNLGVLTTRINDAFAKLQEDSDKYTNQINSIIHNLVSDKEVERIQQQLNIIKTSYKELNSVRDKQTNENLTLERQNELRAQEQTILQNIANALKEINDIRSQSRQDATATSAINALEEEQRLSQAMARADVERTSQTANTEAISYAIQLLEKRKALEKEINQIEIDIAKNGGTADPNQASLLQAKEKELEDTKMLYDFAVIRNQIDENATKIASELTSIREQEVKLQQQLNDARQEAQSKQEKENIQTVVALLEKRKTIESEIQAIELSLLQGKSKDVDYDKAQLAAKQQELNNSKQEYSLALQTLGVSEQEADVANKLAEIKKQQADYDERRKYAENQTITDNAVKNYNEQAKLVEKIHDLEAKRASSRGGSTAVIDREIQLYQQQLSILQREASTIDQTNLSQEQKQRILEAITTLQEIEKLGALKVDEAIKKQIPHLLTFSQVLEQVQIKLVRMGTQMVFRFFREQIREAIEYVTEFSNKLNEISIITGKSQSDADALGESYRALAKTLKASSNDIATAAVTYFRQGLDDSEVNKRIIATTQYAKAANISFSDASEKITASTNALGVSASRVADVFLYLGDHAATSGDEIGEAMSKASAMANAAGVSFEELGAYIAVVSETTRQDARTIGTALNSMMARLMSVKKTGFNEEDETKVNDIAKALKSVNVELTDGQGGWRSMSTIFREVAEKWSTLTDKEKGYLATTIGGTRQQNTFRIIMEDLAKGADGMEDTISRINELYEGAVNSAGTAADKYEIYMQSIAAAQDNFRASMERVYSWFVSSGIIKGFYDIGAGIADALNFILRGGDVQVDYTKAKVAIEGNIESIKELRDEYVSLANLNTRTEAQDKRMTEIVDKLASSHSLLKDELFDTNGAFVGQATAVQKVNEAYEKQIKLLKQVQASEARQNLSENRATVDEAISGLSSNKGAVIVAKDMEEAQSMVKSMMPDMTDEKAWLELFNNLRNLALSISLFGEEQTLEGLNPTDRKASIGEQLSLRLYDLYGSDADWNAIYDYLLGIKVNAGNVWEIISDLQLTGMTKPLEDARNAVNDYLSNYLTIYEAEDDYEKLTENAKTSFKKFFDDFIKGLAEEDFDISKLQVDLQNQLENELKRLLQESERIIREVDDYFGGKYSDFKTPDVIKSYMEELYEASLIPSKNGEFFDQESISKDIEALMEAYNKAIIDEASGNKDVATASKILFNSLASEIKDKYSIKLPFEFVLEDLTDEADIVSDFQKKENDLFTAIKDRLTKQRIESSKSVGFINDIYNISDNVGRGKYNKIVTDFTLMAEDYRDAMFDAYPWLARMVNLLENGKIEEAMKIWNNGLEDAKNNFKFLTEEERKYQEYLLEDRKKNLEKNDFGEWIGILDRGFMNAQSEEAFEEQYQWIKNQNDDLESSFYDTWTSIFGFIGSTFDEQGKLKVSLEQAQANYASWQGSRTTQKQKSANEEAIKAKRKQDLERDAENGYVVERGKLLSYLNAGNDEFTNALKQLSSTGNVDLVTRPFISSFDVIKQGYEDCFEDGFDEAINSISTFFNSTSANQTYAISVTPVLPDGTVLERETFDAYMDKLLSFNSLDEALAYDKANRSLITTGADAAESGGIDKAIAIVEARAEQMHNIHALMLESDLDPSMYTNFKKGLEELGELGVLDDFYNQYAGLKEIIVEADAEIATQGDVTAKTMAKIREALFSNEVAWNKYYESVTKNPALDPDSGVGYLGKIQGILRQNEWGVQNLYAVYQTASDEEKKFIDQYVNMDKLASGAESAKQAILNLHKAMYELNTELESESSGGLSDYNKRIQYEEDALEGYAREAQELKDIILNVEDGQDPVENLLVRMQELESDGILEEMFEQFGSLEEAYVNLKNAWLNDDVDVGSYLDPFINALYQQGEAFDTVAEKAKKNAEASVSYIDKQIDLLRQWQTAISTDTYAEFYNTLSKSQKDWLKDSTEGFEDYISGVMKADEYLDNLKSQEHELIYGKAEARGQIFKGAASMISATQTQDNSITKELENAHEQIDKVYKAAEAYFVITQKLSKNTKEIEQAYKNISALTGQSVEQLKAANGIEIAFQDIQNAASQTTVFTEMVLTELQQAGAIDFRQANWRDQLNALANDSSNAASKLAQLAQALLNLPNATYADVYVTEHHNVVVSRTGDNLIAQVADKNSNNIKAAADTVKKNYDAKKTVLQQSTASKRSGGGGGGGSSKSSTDNLKSEIEKMIDLMKQIQELSEFRQSVFSSLRTQYENKNELQGVILYYNKEKEEIEANNKVLQENLNKIEALLPSQQALVASLATTDENYKDASSDLEKLQSAHMEYTKALIENETKLNEYNKAIKEVYKKIRDMEIDLRNTILQAIEDREEREKSMLEARISMENEVFKIIKKRYEDERDEIIDTAKERQNALKEEASLLDENLRKRKEAAEQEEKQAELLQLQQQLARISADPSRRAEQQKLQKQIQKLQKDLAWDEAEREVEAQKESLNEQVENLDDYIEYVQRYYEDLFEHPKKLLEEVEEIMQKTDDEILEWLKANNEEYAASSESAQRQIVTGWEDTLRTMHGELQLYWDEVEYIIEQGEDYIIQFLMENSADYRAAGKLQAEAYVDEWKEQLENLRLAYKQVYDDFEFYNAYNTIRLDESNGSSSGNSGGNSSSSSNSSSRNNNGGTNTPNTSSPNELQVLIKDYDAKDRGGGVNSISSITSYDTLRHVATENKTNYVKGLEVENPVYNSIASLKADASLVASLSKNSNTSSSNSKSSVGSSDLQDKDKKKVKGYATGGESFDTELAILHGSSLRPERILNETQTALFDMLVQDLHTISRMHVSSSTINGWDGNSTSYGNTFGDIVINVQSLSSDSDYDEMADKVMDVINTRINRGMAVGGIRRTR